MTTGNLANKNIASKEKLISPNLELEFTNQTLNRKQPEKITKNQSSSQKYLRIFKYLILSTTIIFAFGGFGFGMALRYGQNLTMYNSNNIHQNNHK